MDRRRTSETRWDVARPIFGETSDVPVQTRRR